MKGWEALWIFLSSSAQEAVLQWVFKRFMLGILSKSLLPCLWFPRKRKGMLVIPGFYCFECCSESHSAIRSWSAGSRRKKLSASPGSDFHLSSFLWPPYLLLHFMHILPTLLSSSEMMQSFVSGNKQAFQINQDTYWLPSFLFPLK